MNATATKKAAAPKKTAAAGIPLNEFLARRQDEAGMRNYELAEKMGYGSANVVAMLRSGNMAFPVNKVGVTAKALGIDPAFLLTRVLEARNPELLEVLQEILGNQLVTDLEAKMLGWVRKETDGVEFDIDRYPDFKKEFGAGLKEIAKREKALHGASMDAIKRNYKPGPAKKAG
ncbi:hypothetical protein GFK26_17960 [Variovorax paradoxus]|uniref:Uncharacterized protein n=1 Tax=Variovorax paradoxus TaxID=34073 RepID=A0A5Q0M7P6_VARPD|nr:hypothetical protein [Variovorax paradoxus]QFZ84515.1 hypothetical protein GFK26_17960 [Variovorax paradoxus]